MAENNNDADRGGRPATVAGAAKKTAVALVLICGAIALYSLYTRLSPLYFPSPRSVPSTLYQPGKKPDGAIIVPRFDMATSVAITWRTSGEVGEGFARFAKIMDGIPGEFAEVRAETVSLSPELSGTDGAINRHTAVLTNLTPNTAYRYRIGGGERDTWSQHRTFSTGPDTPDTFSFIYVGDTQSDPKRVGAMLEAADLRHPETAFYMIGGDLVDNGNQGHLWNAFLAETEKVFSRKPVAPAMGNHDFGMPPSSRGPTLFNAYFQPPYRERPPAGEVSNYAFRLGSAYFIVVNPHDVPRQAEWLENALRAADGAGCDFKTVMFHHPVYNTIAVRSNKAAEELWVPLFDKYGVDLVLSGHDHNYMRSKRLKAGRPAGDDEHGVTYVVATGCEKFYEFVKLDIAEKQFTNTATYQYIVMGRTAEGLPVLRYQSCDRDGEVLDEFELIKRRGVSGGLTVRQ